MNELDLIMFKRQYSTTLKHVYSFSISSLAIFRTCMLYIGLIGFRGMAVFNCPKRNRSIFYAFTVIMLLHPKLRTLYKCTVNQS